MSENAPFGYEWKDGSLIINNEESSIVKWLFRKVVEYDNEPPDFLIQKVIESSEEELSLDEAKQRASLMVTKYMAVELNERLRVYKEAKGTPENIHQFLDGQLDQELLAEVEKNFDSYMDDDMRLSLLLNRQTKYVGKIKPLSESDHRFKLNSSETTISKEIYERAAETMRQQKESALNEEQDDCSQQASREALRGQSI